MVSLFLLPNKIKASSPCVCDLNQAWTRDEIIMDAARPSLWCSTAGGMGGCAIKLSIVLM